MVFAVVVDLPLSMLPVREFQKAPSKQDVLTKEVPGKFCSEFLTYFWAYFKISWPDYSDLSMEKSYLPEGLEYS